MSVPVDPPLGGHQRKQAGNARKRELFALRPLRPDLGGVQHAQSVEGPKIELRPDLRHRALHFQKLTFLYVPRIVLALVLQAKAWEVPSHNGSKEPLVPPAVDEHTWRGSG